MVLELGLAGVVDLRPVDPWTDEALRAANPLCKVPTLVLDDGSALYDSPVICEYLNGLAEGTLLARSGPERWDALRRQALGDGFAEAVIRRHVEGLGPPGERSSRVVLRQGAAIAAAINAIESEAAAAAAERFDLGDVAIAAALSYFRFRSQDLAETFDCPRLSAWLARIEQRPSVWATRIETAAIG